MPVLVAPADTPLGVLLVRGLRADGAEVRAYATGDGDVGALRAAGAYVAVGDLDDEGRLDAAMTHAHTVIALHADPLVRDADVLARNLEVFLTAAEKADVARVVVRTVPRPAAGDDPLRQVCAAVEARLTELPMPTMSVRTSLVDTTGLRDALVSIGAALRADDLEVAPLHPDDAVDALVALDAARSTVEQGYLVLRLQGQPRPLASYLDHLGDGLIGRVYVPADRAPLLRAGLTTPWSEPDGEATPDLLAFAEQRPRQLAP